MPGYLCTGAFFFPLGSRGVVPAQPPQSVLCLSLRPLGMFLVTCFSGIFIFGSCHTGQNQKLEVEGDSGQNSRFVTINFFTL